MLSTRRISQRSICWITKRMKVLPRYTNENYNWTISSSNMLLKLIAVTFKYVILFLWTILYLIPALQLSQAHTHVAKAGPVHRSPVQAGFKAWCISQNEVPISARAKDWWYIWPMQLAIQSTPALVTTLIKNLPSPSPHSSILIPQSLPPPHK